GDPEQEAHPRAHLGAAGVVVREDGPARERAVRAELRGAEALEDRAHVLGRQRLRGERQAGERLRARPGVGGLVEGEAGGAVGGRPCASAGPPFDSAPPSAALRSGATEGAALARGSTEGAALRSGRTEGAALDGGRTEGAALDAGRAAGAGAEAVPSP